MSFKDNEILNEKVKKLLKKERFTRVFVLAQKKYGNWYISMESLVINKITIGYKFLTS